MFNIFNNDHLDVPISYFVRGRMSLWHAVRKGVGTSEKITPEIDYPEQDNNIILNCRSLKKATLIGKLRTKFL